MKQEMGAEAYQRASVPVLLFYPLFAIIRCKCQKQRKCRTESKIKLRNKYKNEW